MDRTLLFALLATGSFCVSSARADDPWRAVAISYNPEAPSRLAVETNRGVVISDDEGRTWRFMCQALLDRESSLVIGLPRRDATLWGRFGGLSSTSALGCGMASVRSPMADLFISDLQRDPTAPDAWFATTALYDANNALFRSQDDGVSWQQVGDAVGPSFLEAIRTSTNGARWVVQLAHYDDEADQTTYSIRVSDDQAGHWTEHPLSLSPSELEFQLLQIDPANADRFFMSVRTCRQGVHPCFDPEVGTLPDRVIVSDDAGATWRTVLEVNDLGGFAISRTHIWIGDLNGGLWRLDHSGGAPRRIEGLRRPACLALRGDEVLACGELFSDQFLVARSLDSGETWEGLATADSILGAPSCPATDRNDLDAGPDRIATCRAEWFHLCGPDFAFEGVANPPAECGFSRVDAGLDAGTGRPKTSGCACTVTGATSSSQTRTWWELLVAALVLTWRRFWRVRSPHRHRRRLPSMWTAYTTLGMVAAFVVITGGCSAGTTHAPKGDASVDVGDSGRVTDAARDAWISRDGGGDAGTDAAAFADGGLLDAEVGDAGFWETGPVISAGSSHSCYLRERPGVVRCWGRNLQGRATPPLGVQFVDVSAGASHTCGVLASTREVVCWGDNDRDQCDAPQGVAFKTVAAGRYHTCGIRAADHMVQCWGDDLNFQSRAPVNVAFASLSVGGSVSCGVREADRHMQCWGFGQVAGAPTRPLDVVFESIAAGDLHACGVRESDGIVLCWGLDESGQTDAPENTSFDQVSNGYGYSCAIRSADGFVECWGAADPTVVGVFQGGQTQPPTDVAFASLSAGGAHVCGVRAADGKVECWGTGQANTGVSPDYGQAMPPGDL